MTPLERAQERWSRFPDRLHRLATLRELQAGLHAQLSSVATRSSPSDAARAKAICDQCDRLRDQALEENDLATLLNHSTLSRPASARDKAALPKLPPGVSHDALTRSDRRWEAEMIAEGTARGWQLSSLECAIPVPDIEKISTELDELNWPDAIFLFAESRGVEENPPRWRALWIFLHAPGKTPGFPVT